MSAGIIAVFAICLLGGSVTAWFVVYGVRVKCPKKAWRNAKIGLILGPMTMVCTALGLYFAA